MRALLALLMAAAVAGCAGGDDGEEEAGAPEAGPEIGSIVVTQWNDSTELFLEYPHPVAGTATGNWAIHLTELDTYAPVVEGRLAARFLADGREVQRFEMDAPARDGIFLVDPVVREPGAYRVELVLDGPQVTSTHVLDPVRVFPSVAEAPTPGPENEGGGITFLKEQQWPIDFAVAQARSGSRPRTLEVPGEITPRDGGLARVTAPVEAVARADANLDAPSVGARVTEGDVLAVLSPVSGSGGFSDLKSRVQRLEREVARAERLYEAGAAPERRVVEARHDLEVARAELEAVGGDTASGGPSDGSGYDLRIRSPLTGVVASREFVPGGRVAAGSELFTVVDPDPLWLRLRIPARVASEVTGEIAPTFSVEGSSETFTAAAAVSVGSVLDSRTRTLPAIFRVPNPEGTLKVGQTARARLPLGGAVTGVVVPSSAVVMEDGVPVVYVESGGETFERRVVELGASDGVEAVLTAGVRPGEWVVSTGAYQVRLASLSGESFGAGHAH